MKVVNNKKGNESPSTPKAKLALIRGIQENFSVNCITPFIGAERSNAANKMTEIINGMLVAAREIHLIVLGESRGQRAAVRAPAIGIAMVKVKNGMFMLPPLARQ
jgi:hypothetical protein